MGATGLNPRPVGPVFCLPTHTRSGGGLWASEGSLLARGVPGGGASDTRVLELVLALPCALSLAGPGPSSTLWAEEMVYAQSTPHPIKVKCIYTQQAGLGSPQRMS